MQIMLDQKEVEQQIVLREWCYGLPLRPIVKCEIYLHNGTLACLERNLLSGYYQVSSRLPAMAFYDAQSILRGLIPKEPLKCFTSDEGL